MSERNEEQIKKDSELPPAGAAPHPPLAERLGGWAYAHKDTFQGVAGSLAFRNFARTLAAIAPYVFVNVGVQHLFQRTVGSGKTYGFLTPVLKNKYIQSAAAIAFSFTTFRSISKIWNENYDRIFGAKSAEEAKNAIEALPGNIVKDAGKIVPSELAATGLSSIILSTVRGSLKNPEPPGAHHPVGQNLTNDWLANSLGYTVFFEATDRLYSVFNKKHSNGVYEKGTLPDGEDTPARLVFRNGASVFMAALPFIATQRYANFKTGGYHPAKNPYLKDVAHGLLSWELPFAVFTSGMELWQRNYDKLFDKLEAKYAARQR